MLLYTWQEAGKKGRLILSSGAKYNQINFSKNHVSGNARKIGVTFIWWFTIGKIWLFSVVFSRNIWKKSQKGVNMAVQKSQKGVREVAI